MGCFDGLPLPLSQMRIVVPLCVDHDVLRMLPAPKYIVPGTQTYIVKYAVSMNDSGLVYEVKEVKRRLSDDNTIVFADLDPSLLSELLKSIVTLHEIIESMVKSASVIPHVSVSGDGFSIETVIDQRSATVVYRITEVYPPTSSMDEIVANVLNHATVKKIDISTAKLEVEVEVAVNEPEHGNATKISLTARREDTNAARLTITPLPKTVMVDARTAKKIHDGISVSMHLIHASNYHLYRARENMRVLVESLSLINITQ